MGSCPLSSARGCGGEKWVGGCGKTSSARDSELICVSSQLGGWIVFFSTRFVEVLTPGISECDFING